MIAIGDFDEMACFIRLITLESDVNGTQSINLGAGGRGIDFIWRYKFKNEVFKYYQWTNDDKEKLELKGEVEVFKSVSFPTLDGYYYFGGAVKQWTDSYNKRIDGQFVLHQADYLGERDDGYYYDFKLSSPVDSSLLYGLSGTPIFDEENNLVSLLVGGCKGKSDWVYGINLQRIVEIIDIQESVKACIDDGNKKG